MPDEIITCPDCGDELHYFFGDFSRCWYAACGCGFIRQANKNVEIIIVRGLCETATVSIKQSNQME